MPSTYSPNLAIQLMQTGEKAGQWGSITNTNLGELIEQAISGYVQHPLVAGDNNVYIPNGSSGVARNMYLELTGVGGSNLIVPGQTGPTTTYKKLYFIYNNTSSPAAAVTVKVSGQTGVSVPAGKKYILVCDGTDVVQATTNVLSLSGTSGRITVTGGQDAVVDLAASGVTPNTYGSSSLVPVITVDTYGRVTNVTTASNPQGTVTSVSVATANGLAGTSSGGATPQLTLSTTVSGLLKGNGTTISAASSGVDYAPATSGTSILYGNGSGGFSPVTIGSNLTFAGGTLSATGGGGGTISGSGTTNYVPKFSSSTAIDNSQIFDNGTNVGVGTASPVFKLDVSGNIRTPDSVLVGTSSTGYLGYPAKALISIPDYTNYYGLAVQNAIAGGSYGVSLDVDDSGTAILSATVPSGQNLSLFSSYDILINSANNTIFRTNSVERMRIASSGNVGIGTASPTAKLEVVGAITSTGGSVTADSFIPTSSTPPTNGMYLAGTDLGFSVGSAVRATISTTGNFATTGSGYIDAYGYTLRSYTSGPPTYGITSPGGTSLAFSANSAYRMYITSAGDVGIGTASPAAKLHVVGDIVATGNITAYYSDDRLKTRKGNIENALDKVLSLDGFHYEANEAAQALGYEVKPEVGLSAQQVQAVLPEVIAPAPIDNQYLTIRYERLIPLLVESIKELNKKVEALEAKLETKCECCK